MLKFIYIFARFPIYLTFYFIQHNNYCAKACTRKNRCRNFYIKHYSLIIYWTYLIMFYSHLIYVKIFIIFSFYYLNWYIQMFTQIFVVLGVIFCLSLLGYIIPQLIICFSKPLDLKQSYGGGWAFISSASSGIGEALAKNVTKDFFQFNI